MSGAVAAGGARRGLMHDGLHSRLKGAPFRLRRKDRLVAGTAQLSSRPEGRFVRPCTV